MSSDALEIQRWLHKQLGPDGIRRLGTNEPPPPNRRQRALARLVLWGIDFLQLLQRAAALYS